MISQASVLRSEFEKNLLFKKKNKVFRQDIFSLLSNEQINDYDLEKAYRITCSAFIDKIKD